ncbi:MAG: hypothetical protein ACLFS1_02310 [Opitutales bacterium]
MAASYLGGSGDEYLIAGDFLPDGTLYLAGNAFGPNFDLGETQVTVLGQDTAAPEFSMPVVDGSPRPKESWKYTSGAGFIVALAPDYREIVQAVRFPWGSGVITDLVTDGEGHVYVTGTVGANFSSLVESEKLTLPDIEGPDEIFIARLKRDLSGFYWVKRFADEAENTPQMRHIGEGRISLVGRNGFHLNAEGKVLKSQPLGITSKWQQGVDFISFGQLKGNFHRTGTGWEPWHRPFAYIYNPDGTLRFRFYQWDSRTVGMNYSRLVSDSRLEVATFDRKGQPIIAGWSDGGNSVWTRVPYDLKRGVRKAIREETGRKTGLPFSSWGAGVGSFTHLNRLDFETGNPLSYTLFATYLKDRDKPNSARANYLDFSVDNDLLMAGTSAWGLIETRELAVNTLDEDEDYMGGAFITLLTENWDDIRFSSLIPGAGKVDLARHSARKAGMIRFGSAHVGGKTRVVAVSGAESNEKFSKVSPVQAGFGGGHLDGLFVVLEMETIPPAPKPQFVHPSFGARDVSMKESDPKLDGYFVVNEKMKNNDSLLYLRDTSGKKWPAYYRGNPVGDGLIDAEGSGSFVLRGPPDRVQLGGEADEESVSRRLGGDSGREELYPELEMSVRLLSESKALIGVVYNGRQIEREGRVSIRKSGPVGKGVAIQGFLRVTKAELGLDSSLDGQDDEVIVGWWAPGRPAPEGSNRSPVKNPRSGDSPQRSEVAFEFRTWTNDAGREVEAKFEKILDAGVRMQLVSGPFATVALDTLSKKDRDWIYQQTGFRVWTSNDGATIIAKKRAVEKKLLTLEIPSGKSYTFPIDRLSPEDRKYARR